MLKIKKNDIVTVCAGKDKGKKGKVLYVFPKENRALVEGANFIKKHTRKTREDAQGGIIQKESPIQISKLMLFCSKCNKPTRVGFSLLKDGTKTRICKRCREVIG
ncbi:MAG: 50S ribosomal protein L24 [Candidatus Omnitrophica bacterium]|nr:50S ribosomal protein L24 [Candidatus Omnitrophota bacterium]